MSDIILKNFRARRGGFVVGPIDLKVDGGERALIYGPNGSGKTTVLLGIIGAADADGSISVAGRDVSHLPLHERGISYVPAQPVLPGWITVKEILRVTGGRETAVDLLEGFNLGWTLNRPTSVLSTGERKLVQAIIAISSNAEVLLFDEPFSNLSRDWVSRLQELLRGEPRPIMLTHHEWIPTFDAYVRLPLGT